MVTMIIAYFVHIKTLCVKILGLMLFDTMTVTLSTNFGENMTSAYKITDEKPYPLGCYIDYDKSLVVRAVFNGGSKRGITLYRGGNKKNDGFVIELPADCKRGNIYSARISGIKDVDSYTEYNLFEDEEYFCDPYAKLVIGLEKFGAEVEDSDIKAKLDNKSLRSDSSSCFDWGKSKAPQIPYEDSLIYLMHVRGFTKSTSSGLPADVRGTFSGIIQKLDYLKSLGVTCIELMPVYEMNELQDSEKRSGIHSAIKSTKALKGSDVIFSRNGSITNKGSLDHKVNFWGYKRGYYFAPRTSYCVDPSNAENEVKSFIKTMHENGIEVVLQFYFEADESESIIIDALRYWRCTYRVDGFHVKGARLPLRNIAKDPLFADVKIWHEWFDYGDIYGGKPVKKRFLAEYNNTFLNSSRKFLKSDDNTAGDFLKAMIANGCDHGIVNYICNYEGFRLADLVSFEHKRNEENGENNKDGTDENYSWNCGIEGRTRKKSILDLRNRQIKNILTMLILAQGTPMIFSGDEFGNSQGGNNNPYCQDNETGWVDWKALEKNGDILEYVKFLMGVRKAHVMFREPAPFKLMDYISCGYPDFSCHGRDAWRPDFTAQSHVLGLLYCGLYDKKSDDKSFVYVCYNMCWNKSEIALPKLPDGESWKLISDTACAEQGIGAPSEKRASDPDKVTLSERSVRIYQSFKNKKENKRKSSKKK